MGRETDQIPGHTDQLPCLWQLLSMRQKRTCLMIASISSSDLNVKPCSMAHLKVPPGGSNRGLVQ